MRKNQPGLTLVELLVATAISAIILGVMSTALSQTVSISWAGHKRMDAIKQVENAMYSINRDVQAASSISTSASGSWLAVNLADNSTIDYRIVDPGGQAPVYLERTYAGSETAVAQYVDIGSGLTVCSYDGSVLDVQVTATLGGWGSASETRRVVIYPRLNLSSQQ